MNSLTQSLVVAVVSVLACTSLHAQNVDMKAVIPFDFHAGNTVMPAGEYLIHEQGQFVILHGLDGPGRVTSFLTNSALDAAQPEEGRLRFNRYGSEYFLTEIWNPTSQYGHQLIPTARETQLAKGGRPVKGTVIVASNK
jgi:hypothetical protein